MGFMEVTKVLIIPDIHGRTFWKEAVEQFLKEDILAQDRLIVFLGDYFDPYPKEHINQDDAIKNFRQIIKFKQECNGAAVHLLIGNHDMHYISSSFGHCSRYDYRKAPQIKKLFKLYEDMFEIAVGVNSGGKYVILSHAGIQKNWVRDCLAYTPDDAHIVNYLNAEFDYVKKDEDSIFVHALDEFSIYRGNIFCKHGSVVWADTLEYFNKDTEIYGDFQIFGHTQSTKPYVSGGFNFACLDCHEAFILEDGIIKYMNGEPVEIIDEKAKEE